MAVDTQAILNAVQTTLAGDAPLIAVVPATQIGPHLQDNTPFPHIRWNIEAENWGIKQELSYRFTLVFDVWTEVRGVHQCWEISDLLTALLDQQTVTVAGSPDVVPTFEGITVDSESDGRTRHATITFLVLASA